MEICTILSIIGYCFLASSWIVHWIGDKTSEKILTVKTLLAGIGMGVFISAMIVNLYHNFVK